MAASLKLCRWYARKRTEKCNCSESWKKASAL